MRKFEHTDASSFEEASKIINASANGSVISGGTDLIGTMKQAILEKAPDIVVNLKTIKGADYITIENDRMSIGALTKLADIEEDEEVRRLFPGLAKAAHSVATPIIRSSATIGGNICQDVRCWYYRYPHLQGGRFQCARKGGELCYAIMGDNRYHSIFGGKKAGVTPCSLECPAGTNIPGYMAKLRDGDWDGAAKIILRVNPFPMLTSRVCPHTCQSRCNQCKHGDSVGIHSIERTLGDYILSNADLYYQAPKNETGKKSGIVGAGPAGLTAAFYLRKQGHQVTIYDKMEEAGGVLMYGIPEYRLPKHYVRDVVKALKNIGIVFKTNTEVGKDIKIEEIEAANDTVFLDTGAWKQPILGIEGENLTRFGLNFLVEVKGFMSRQIGRNVLVCGGGNVAMDVALTAKRLGAETVTLVCLEQREQMPASTEEIARAEEEGVKIINGRGLHKVQYAGEKVTGMETNRCVSLYDENGRFSPEYDNQDLSVIPSDCIILATGQRVDLDFLGERFKNEIQSARGLIEVGEHNDTRKPGVYAGGDAATGPSVAIKAIRAGANAAKSMSKYMGYPIEVESNDEGLLRFNQEGIYLKEKQCEKDIPAAERCLDTEDTKSLTNEEAILEAGRCMNCGCYSVNASDLASILLALDAEIVTTERKFTAEQFFTSALRTEDVLNRGEIVMEIQIPIRNGWLSDYEKFRLRKSIDFALTAVASNVQVKNGIIEDVRMVFGGVAPTAYRAYKLEKLLKGQKISEDLAIEAGNLAVEDAIPMKDNGYKVEALRSMVANAVRSLA
jgi:NADPH-dependent glutamate synthase beta subunit-like oxidoreductase/CO/xanthine dehydrogenase FAD-binding subunit